MAATIADDIKIPLATAAAPGNEFAAALLGWFDVSGRKHLPWQQRITPYRVWVSEIMLQQTQVATVIPYYERFMQRFPEVQALAAAPEDEVLHLWTGLGYYARARNLLQASRRIVADHGGEFPDTLEAVQALPGIGRSTAGAILAISKSQRHPILDGNVKRVLTRYFGIQGFPGETAVERQLWSLADACTPAERVADYTQAIMDLGATVCVRSRPLCVVCPMHDSCVARREGMQALLPTPRPRKERPAPLTPEQKLAAKFLGDPDRYAVALLDAMLALDMASERTCAMAIAVWSVGEATASPRQSENPPGLILTTWDANLTLKGAKAATLEGRARTLRGKQRRIRSGTERAWRSAMERPWRDLITKRDSFRTRLAH